MSDEPAILLAGWYIITYGLGIYVLNLLIGFLSPQADPESEGPMLPTSKVPCSVHKRGSVGRCGLCHGFAMGSRMRPWMRSAPQATGAGPFAAA